MARRGRGEGLVLGEYLLDSCMPAVRLLPNEIVAEGWRPDEATERFRSV